MVLRHLFTEIFQRCDGPLTHLYLIEEDQRAACNYFDALCGFKVLQDLRGRYLGLEKRAELLLDFQVEIEHLLIMLPPELADDIGLANLTGTVDNEWHPPRIALPFFQCLADFSSHGISCLCFL